jgi:hypothetical protein
MPADAGAADRAEKQNAEDEIFGEVCALANDVMDVADLVMGEVRQEPVEERLDDSTRVLGGEEIGGHEENEAGPEHGGQPGAQPTGDER